MIHKNKLSLLHISVLKHIISQDKEFILTGSSALWLRGILKREPQDIDIYINDLTAYINGEYLDEPVQFPSIKELKFDNSVVKIYCARVKGVKVDIIHDSSGLPVYDLFYLGDYEIKVARAQEIIDAKLRIIGRTDFEQSSLKHITDLLNIGYNYKEINKAISTRINKLTNIEKKKVGTNKRGKGRY